MCSVCDNWMIVYEKEGIEISWWCDWYEIIIYRNIIWNNI